MCSSGNLRLYPLGGQVKLEDSLQLLQIDGGQRVACWKIGDGRSEMGNQLPAARGVAHDGEEEEHLEDVDEDEDAEEDIKSGQGQVSQATEEGIGQQRDPEHARGQEEAGFELAVFGVEEGKGEGEGHRADDDKEKQDQRDLFAGVHVRDSG